MPQTRTLIDIAGSYVDPSLICFAKQKGANEVLIFIQGTDQTVTVGKDFWFKIVASYFNVVTVS
jgi:hypothetical protein